jgi:hypothetical protein
MTPTLKVAVNCKGCGASNAICISHGNETTALAAIGWDYIYDTAQGIEIAPFCPNCMLTAKTLAKQLQDLVKLEHWHFACLVRKK